MENSTNLIRLRPPHEIDDPLTEVLRVGARRLLAQAVEMEAEAFLAAMQDLRLSDGRARLVRHGHAPEREIQTGIGPVLVSRVRIRDRGASGPADRVRFSSNILPKWARRTRSLDALLPVLYLRGISTGDFQEALAALLGKDAPNLSPSVVTRLTATWADEYARWQARDLSAHRYVYVWADGVYLQARMEEQAECMLVLIGATHEGKKELVGFQVGVRESVPGFARASRGSRERPKLARTAGRGEAARAGHRARDRSWRRGARLLASARRTLSWHAPSALLAAQDRQRSQQGAEIGPEGDEGGSARDPWCAHPRGSRGGHGRLCREVWEQVRPSG